MSLIEELKSKNGLPIFKLGGVHVCSSYAPEREAIKWVADIEKQARASRVIFVLGLGCGYHAAELASASSEKKIIVIERDIEQINWFWRNTQRQTENLEVYHLKDAADIGAWQPFLRNLSLPYTVARFASAMRLDTGYYSRIESMLLARDINSMRSLQDILGDKKSPFPGEIEADENEGINIANVKKAMATRDVESFSKRDRIWTALTELVK